MIPQRDYTDFTKYVNENNTGTKYETFLILTVFICSSFIERASYRELCETDQVSIQVWISEDQEFKQQSMATTS
jgi:hypothetical protein